MNPTPETLRFVNALFRNCSGANVEFRFLPSRQQIFTSLDQLEIPALPQDQNCYVGVATRNGGGSKENVVEIPSLWVDVDFRSLPEEEAKGRLAKFPLKPSILLESGGGFHVYWLLQEPAGQEEIPAIESLNHALAHVLGGDLGSCDAARILRLPGTWNLKYQPARPVKILSIEPDRQYLLSDFEEILPEIPKSNRNCPATAAPDEKIRNGKRNVTLMSLAGTMRRRGMTGEGIEAALKAENTARCEPALDPDEVCSIARSVERYAPAVSTASVEAHLTDLGNAQRFAADHGGKALYCHPWHSWLVFTGQRWERDSTGHVFRLAQETVRSIYRSAADLEDEARKTLAAHALKSESAKKLTDMLALARSLLPCLPDDFDRDPMLFNMANGTLDLQTGDLRPHRPEDRITHLSPVVYDPKAECRLFQKCVAMWTNCSDPLARYLQTVAGYSITGVTHEDKLFIGYGSGDNGKTTFTNSIRYAMGTYAAQTPTETLMARKGDANIPNDLARLKGTRLVTAMESEQGRYLAESLIKQLTGGDPIAARFLHAEWFEFVPQFKIFLSTNHKPRIRGTEHAVWRRIALIPFVVKIPKKDQTKDLEEKLKVESAGVFNWILGGCFRYQQEGLGDPEEVKEATARYREENDLLADFLAERCVVEPDGAEESGELYRAYHSWAEDAGEKPDTQTAFGLWLSERGFEARPGGKNRRKVRQGIRLRREIE